ncbi:MAG: Homing endonuclease LAGLIDADG/HNH [Parcubacteria group bacterium Gr01-1014_38]|nr:MAG: Homing endonuclease LAGLIDADG/HNH [Parcubacteria group bacterium Gr01-1014_38]
MRENTERTALTRERPDNQQERLNEFIHWLRGFVDGEGCFTIGFVAQPDIPDPKRPGGYRKAYRTGYQVDHSFDVVQGARSRRCLEKIKNFFGIGHIYRNRRHDNHREDLYNYEVSKRADLLNVIIPFFRKYPLFTAKQKDFERFAKIVEMMARGEHKTFNGLVKIARIVQYMNHRKPRVALIRILRDHTPGNRAISPYRLRD